MDWRPLYDAARPPGSGGAFAKCVLALPHVLLNSGYYKLVKRLRDRPVRQTVSLLLLLLLQEEEEETKAPRSEHPETLSPPPPVFKL